MERCANTEALNSYHRQLEKQEKIYEELLDYIDDDMVELQELIEKIVSISKDYENIDFSPEIKELIREFI